MRGVCEETFSDLGVFKQKNFVRMQDAKLITELCHALLNGIVTTNKRHLNSLYASFNKEFTAGTGLRKRLLGSLQLLKKFEVIKNSPLAKSYNFYSLVLAAIHIKQSVAVLSPDLEGLSAPAPASAVAANLGLLSEALEDADNPPEGLETFSRPLRRRQMFAHSE